MKVALKYYTPLDIALEAGLICTDSENKIDDYSASEFLGKLVKQGHESVIEHINYSFLIDGVSRSVLQEIARHRHISLSVKSTRWALKKFADTQEYYSPIDDNTPMDKNQFDMYEKLNEKSKELRELVVEAVKAGIPNDKLKYYLQESLTTKLMLTCNLRELRLMFNLRTSKRALKEFQDLCWAMYETLPERHKELVNDVMHKELTTIKAE
jgi:thymidylate synthase (FAD)